MSRIPLRQHFDDDLFIRSRVKHRVDRRQMLIETHIHHAAAHRADRRAGFAGVVGSFIARSGGGTGKMSSQRLRIGFGEVRGQ